MNDFINKKIGYDEFKKEVLHDYYLCLLSRQLNWITMDKKACITYLDEGKELAQTILAKYICKGDWHSSYEYDKTWRLATELLTPIQFFHNVLNTLSESDTATSNLNLINHINTVSDNFKMNPCLAGLAFASKWYRKSLPITPFSNYGNEVAFGTVSLSNLSETDGIETIHAACVHHIPVVLLIWDSELHSNAKQTAGFEERYFKFHDDKDMKIFHVKNWDYSAIATVFNEGMNMCRKEHIPVIFYLEEVYTSDKETNLDPLLAFKKWIIDNQLASLYELENLVQKVLNEVNEAQKKAWEQQRIVINRAREDILYLMEHRICESKCRRTESVKSIMFELRQNNSPVQQDIVNAVPQILEKVCSHCMQYSSFQHEWYKWLLHNYKEKQVSKASFINQILTSAITKPQYENSSPWLPSTEIIYQYWDKKLEKNNYLLHLREENKVYPCFEELQKKYGELRIIDCDETMLTQSMGMSMRGLKPVVNISYELFSKYAGHWQQNMRLSPIDSQPNASIIISLHRNSLVQAGISLNGIMNFINDVVVIVPRDITQTAGFYNTLLKSNITAIVIEPFTSMELKEKCPENMDEYTVSIGVPEIIQEGDDITLVTYGSGVSIAQQAVKQLHEIDISVELLDVQTLHPFDVNHIIFESIKKTNKIIFFDEDISGFVSSMMIKEVIDSQNGFYYLNAPPVTVTAKSSSSLCLEADAFNIHVVHLFEQIYKSMHHYNPTKYPWIFG